MDSVLALQAQANAPVDRFHLKCLVVEAYWLLNWIDNVLKRGVSNLDLYISSPWPSSDSIYYLLPSEMYVSKTLVKLKIRFIGGVFIKVLHDVSLPKLKTLHLDWIQIEKRTFNKLLSSCHALEELVLVNLKLLRDSWQPKPLPFTMSFDSLVEARLSFQESTEKTHETNLLMGIRNVKILYLSDDTLEVLGHCREIIPVFNNLLHLTITTPYVQ
ncbi:putative F-box/LRR-repeat protein [Cardamine amara subsp. amara]|uniref:F-box/LRR-repeat protein n=1 Tax=Cardamine amara subsp. amara TaxID=228776 RepID=A0ABD1ABV0_CARAN